MLALVSPELIRATCDHLSDVNQGGAFVFEERRVWCRVLDQTEQMQCEVSLGRETFDVYQPGPLASDSAAAAHLGTAMVFPVWFEDLRQTIEQQEKEHVESVKKERERQSRAGLQQGRSEKELEALLKQEAEKDRERDLRLCLRINTPALLSEMRPVLVPGPGVVPNPDACTFPSDTIALCGFSPAQTLFVTSLDLACYNMHANIDPARFHRWRISYRVTNDLLPIPVEKPLRVDMYTHGICVNATTFSNKLNNFVIITDRFIDVTIHGNQLILFQEDDGRIMIPIEGRLISPLHVFNSAEIHARRLEVAASAAHEPAAAAAGAGAGAADPWLDHTWGNQEPLTQRHLLRHLFFASKAKAVSERVFITMSAQHGIMFHYPTVGYGCSGSEEEKDLYTRYQLFRPQAQ